MRRQTRRFLIVVAVASVFLLAGCGADDSDSAGAESAGDDSAAREEAEFEAEEEAAEAEGEAAISDEDAAADGAEAAEEAGEGGTAPAESGGVVSGQAARAVIDTRHIIFTGSITIRVEDVDEAARAIATRAERYGGFVGEDRRFTAEDSPEEATLVLRIPSEQFSAAVDDLGDLGEEEARELRTEDVTIEVVDLETQIETAEASVDRTRDLMEQATSIEDVVRIERELSEREALLASLQARQRTLRDLTTLSTITVRLLGPDSEPENEDGENGFLAGLSSGWGAFTGSLTVGLTVFGVMLPWLVALGIPAAVIWWVRRRRPAPAPAPQASPPAAQPSPPAAQASHAPPPATPPAT